MPARAARGEDEPPDGLQLVSAEIEPAEHGRGGILVQAAPHGIANRFWLLIDFLEHVM
jgi:hypothetical protein